MSHEFTRRGFIAAATATGVGLTCNQGRSAAGSEGRSAAGSGRRSAAGSGGRSAAGRLAVLGGKPVRSEPFPSWPRVDELDERAVGNVLRSGNWFRGGGRQVDRFEKAYAKLNGSPHCIATANGTGALLAALSALGIGPGDEVILPPYTFVATLNVVLAHHALPIFVDTDRETFQIDAGKIEAAVTDRTAAIMPVHLGGSAADMDTILTLAGKHKLPVVEDACQAHLAQWRGRKVGTLGSAGCFSFQVTKNLCSGEGGAILANDGELAARCYAMHNNSRGRRTDRYQVGYYPGRGINLRMAEFQGALLLAQMTRLEEHAKTREENARYLTGLLREIPGITPARMYEGCTRNAYHLYMFRYRPEQFARLPRTKFLEALRAEGIRASGGYSPLNKQPFLRETLNTRGYQRIYSQQRIKDWEQRNHCPQNDRLCEEAAWLTQNMLLGPRGDMDQIADAVRKIHAHADRLARA